MKSLKKLAKAKIHYTSFPVASQVLQFLADRAARSSQYDRLLAWYCRFVVCLSVCDTVRCC